MLFNTAFDGNEMKLLRSRTTISLAFAWTFVMLLKQARRDSMFATLASFAFGSTNVLGDGGIIYPLEPTFYSYDTSTRGKNNAPLDGRSASLSKVEMRRGYITPPASVGHPSLQTICIGTPCACFSMSARPSFSSVCYDRR